MKRRRTSASSPTVTWADLQLHEKAKFCGGWRPGQVGSMRGLWHTWAEYLAIWAAVRADCLDTRRPGHREPFAECARRYAKRHGLAALDRTTSEDIWAGHE